MKGTILSIKVTGTETIREIDGEPTLELLKEAIGGGYLEIVPGFNRYKHNGEAHDCVAFCDEEGKLEGMSYNADATRYWQQALLAQGHPGLVKRGVMLDYLVGTIAIVWGDDEFMEAL